MTTDIEEQIEMPSRHQTWSEMFRELSGDFNPDDYYLVPNSRAVGDVVVSVTLEMPELDMYGRQMFYRNFTMNIFVPAKHIKIKCFSLNLDNSLFSAWLVISLPFNIEHMMRDLQAGRSIDQGWALFDYSGAYKEEVYHRTNTNYQVVMPLSTSEEFDKSINEFLTRLANEDWFWMPDALADAYRKCGIQL